MIQALIISIIGGIIVVIIIASITHRESLIRYLRCILIYHNKELRVSMAAILKISREGYYILIRNIHRPEVFGPFGGVYKFYESSSVELNQCNFRPQTPNDKLPGIMKNDLRGFIPCKDFAKFMRWFNSGKDRELDCLTRELKEELRQIGLKEVSEKVEIPKFRLIRTVQEGPNVVPGYSYLQFRLINVYEFISDDPNGQEITDLLFENAEHNPNLLVVTDNEIIKRRARNKQIIGAYTGYLFSQKRTGPEEAPFT